MKPVREFSMFKLEKEASFKNITTLFDQVTYLDNVHLFCIKMTPTNLSFWKHIKTVIFPLWVKS